MLNEDELRDALLLVFANKQDLPVSINQRVIFVEIFFTDLELECYECCGDH